MKNKIEEENDQTQQNIRKRWTEIDLKLLSYSTKFEDNLEEINDFNYNDDEFGLYYKSGYTQLVAFKSLINKLNKLLEVITELTHEKHVLRQLSTDETIKICEAEWKDIEKNLGGQIKQYSYFPLPPSSLPQQE